MDRLRRNSRPRSNAAVWQMLLLTFASLAVAVTNDFSSYPENSQDCLYTAASSNKCNSASSASDLNKCLCLSTASDFVMDVAECVGESDSADLSEVYSTMSEACTDTGSPMDITEDEFMAAASNATATASASASASASATASATATSTGTSTSATSTSTANATDSGNGTSTSTSSSDNSFSSMPQKTQISIIVGASVFAVVLVVAVVYYLLRRPQKQLRGEENRPILQPGAPGAPGSTELSLLSPPPAYDWKMGAPGSADTKVQYPQYPAPAMTSMSYPAELASPHQAVFEMPATPAEPVEMPDTSIAFTAAGMGAGAGGDFKDSKDLKDERDFK